MKITGPFALLILAAACAASAQQLYRGTDEQGRTHVTDTPPPASARDVQMKRGSRGNDAEEPQQPYELRQAMRDYPVTLYTSPNCKDPCAAARALLNKRGVPFKEVQVWDETSNQELKRLSGGEEVPTLAVGRSVHRGYAQAPWDALLDSARYPRAGLLPARSQAAPPLPQGYRD
jgi:glutaredoxin